MKKWTILIACILLVFLCGAAAADTEINETNFPDANFREYVSSRFDSDEDGILSDDEAGEVTEIFRTSASFRSIQGIEFFPNLVSINVTENQLTELDISKTQNWRDCTARKTN